MKRVIHCETREQFNKVLEIFQEKGWVWCTGTLPLENKIFWEVYKEETCLRYGNFFAYSPKKDYMKYNCEVISFEEFLKLES